MYIISANFFIALFQAFHPFLNVISGLQTELAAAALDHGEAQAEISKRKSETNKVKGEMKHWQNENYMISEQLSYAEQTIADLTENVRKLDQDNDDLQQKLHEVRNFSGTPVLIKFIMRTSTWKVLKIFKEGAEKLLKLCKRSVRLCKKAAEIWWNILFKRIQRLFFNFQRNQHNSYKFLAHSADFLQKYPLTAADTSTPKWRCLKPAAQVERS